MAGQAEHVVRLKALDGTWETCGVDRLRGVIPDQDSFELTWNDWGSDACSFTLQTDPRRPRPDLSAFTPSQIFVAGVKAWAGRVKQTPASDGSDRKLTMQGEGRQYELDDDAYERTYVHSRIGEWHDIRTF